MKPRPRPRKGSASRRKSAGSAAARRTTLEHLPRRLRHLYEINKLLARFESVEETFDSALAVANETLPLRSAILTEVEDGRSKVIVWPSTTENTEEMEVARRHAQAQVAYLMAPAASGAAGSTEQAGKTALPARPHARRKAAADRRFFVVPLVSGHRPIFGALQLEPTGKLERADLAFASAIANQLAVALDRDRAWRADIRRRQQAEELSRENLRLLEQAQHAIRVRDQILAIVSHDLRNPLSTVIMVTQGLIRRSAGADEQTAAAGAKILRATHRMNRLIEDLLDFANIEAGRLRIDVRPEQPASIVKETAASFEGAAKAGGIQLHAVRAADLPELICDRGRVLQVLSNLVSNAVKVVPPGGRITVSAEVVGDELRFVVADTGPGIGPEDKKHLFERYWRSAEATYKGTGLGLAIANALVKAHGGRLWVESEPGHGATFFIALPTTRSTAPPPSAIGPATSAGASALT